MLSGHIYGSSLYTVTSPHGGLMRQNSYLPTNLWLTNTISFYCFCSISYFYKCYLFSTAVNKKPLTEMHVLPCAHLRQSVSNSSISVSLRLPSDVFNQDCLIKRLAQVIVSTHGIASVWQWGRKLDDAPFCSTVNRASSCQSLWFYSHILGRGHNLRRSWMFFLFPFLHHEAQLNG